MARPWLVPNYGQLTQVDIPGNLRSDRQLDLQRAQLSQQRRAASRSDALAKQELDARIADQKARNQLGVMKQQAATSKARSKRQGDARQELLDSAVSIYGANKGKPESVILDNLRARVAQYGDRLGPQATQQFLSALGDPQGSQAILSDLKGRWSQEAESTSGAKSPTDFLLKDGRIVSRITSGKRRYFQDSAGDPISISTEEFRGARTIPTSEAYTKAAATKLGKVSVDQYTQFRDDANVAYGDISNLKAIRAQANVLPEYNFGISAVPTEVSRKFGMAINSLAGEDIFDTDANAAAIVDTLKARSTDLALKFTERTKGAISDKEMDLFLQAVPNLAQTKGGFMMVLDVMESMANRAIDSNRLAEQFVRSKDGIVPWDLGAKVKDQFKDKPLLTRHQLAKLLERDVSEIPEYGSIEVDDTTGKKYKYTFGDPLDRSSWELMP